MNLTVLLIITAVITLLSLLLKFIKLAMENTSLFSEIEKKYAEIMQLISKLKIETDTHTLHKHFRLAISDWFSGLAILLSSFGLIMEYVGGEYLTRTTVFHIGLLFSLLLFNLIFLSISTMERRLGYWIDEFMAVIGHILKSSRQAKKKRTSRSRKK